MKFIKTYESFFDVKYEVGDYVTLTNNVFCKIIEVNRVTQSYRVEYLHKGKVSEGWVGERAIKDENDMTSEEIENFEIEKAAIKYNL